jgi:hypothetical protein
MGYLKRSLVRSANVSDEGINLMRPHEINGHVLGGSPF